jgi:hypothetical protein
MMDLSKITIQVEQGPRTSRLTIRHEEPLTEDMLAAIFMDTGLRIIKRQLGFDDHGLGEGPALDSNIREV